MMNKIWAVCFLCVGLLEASGQVRIYSDPEPVSSLNSPESENFLSISRDGKSLFFAREKYALNKGGERDAADIWISQKDSAWSAPANISINDAAFASPIGTSADGKYFLYNHVRYEKGLHVGEVRIASSGSGKYRKARELEIPYFSSKSPMQTGMLSYDGKYLLLSLEKGVGYGVEDLYVCELQSDGKWSGPKNLGYRINTPFQEVTPFLAADNKTLFFATNARDGHGSFDIYVAERLDDTWQKWSEPVNLGSRVNSSGSETSFVFAPGGEYAYFSSTQNSNGYGDVKRVRIQAEIEPVAMDSVQAISLPGDETSAVVFQLRNVKTGAPVMGIGKAVSANGDTLTLTSGQDGRIALTSKEKAAYRIEFKSQGYLSVYQVVNEASYGKEVIEVNLDPLEEGNVITLRDVLFYRGTANFIEGSESALDLVVEMLNENPDIAIFLKGHTDNWGDPMLNLQLSRARVRAVEDYLRSKGISAYRIDGEGYGGNQPIASNDSEETRKLNRRVEFEVRKN